MDADKVINRSTSLLKFILWLGGTLLAIQTPPGQWALNQTKRVTSSAGKLGQAFAKKVSRFAIWTLRIALIIYLGCGLAALISWKGFNSPSTAYWLFFCGSLLTCLIIAALYGKERDNEPDDSAIRKIVNYWHYALVGMSMLITTIAIMVDYSYFLPPYVASGDLRMGLIFGTIALLMLLSVVFGKRKRKGLVILFGGRTLLILWLVWLNWCNGEIIILTQSADKWLIPGGKSGIVVPAGTIVRVDRWDSIKLDGNVHAFACYPTDPSIDPTLDCRSYLWLNSVINYDHYKPPKAPKTP